MISINEAIDNDVTRIRMPKWANREDHLRLTIIDGKLGPWIELHSPLNEVLGEENPQQLLVTGFDLDDPIYEIWEIKTGPHWVDKNGHKVLN